MPIMFKRFWTTIFLLANLFGLAVFALQPIKHQKSEVNFSIPNEWASFQPILKSRLTQTSLKMKLRPKEVTSFISFLKTLTIPTPELSNLQKILPKTTLELLMAVHTRGLALTEAEKMAHYLKDIVEKFKFKNSKAFDENTSHIIGREWHEIDYSGEGMTWQKQRLKYLAYGVVHFKSLEYLEKFFPVESQLPYFKKAYHPQNPDALETKSHKNLCISTDNTPIFILV